MDNTTSELVNIVEPSEDTDFKGWDVYPLGDYLTLVCYQYTQEKAEELFDNVGNSILGYDDGRPHFPDGTRILDEIRVVDRNQVRYFVEMLEEAKSRRDHWEKRFDESTRTTTSDKFKRLYLDIDGGGEITFESEGWSTNYVLAKKDADDLLENGVSIRGRHLEQFIDAFEQFTEGDA